MRFNSYKKSSLKQINFEGRKPSNIIPAFTDKREFSFSFAFFSEEEINVLKTTTSGFKMTITISEEGKSEEEPKMITKEYVFGEQQVCFIESFNPNTTYLMKIRIEHLNDGLCA